MRRLLLASLIAYSALLYAAETPVRSWQTLQLPLTPLAFADSSQKTADLLDQLTFAWDELGVWQEQADVADGETVRFDEQLPGVGRAVGLAATFVTADQYAKATVHVTGTRPLKLFANGKELAKAAAKDSAGYTAKAELTLDRSRTELLIVTVAQESDSGHWEISAKVSQDSTSTAVIRADAKLKDRTARFEYDAKLHDFPVLVMSPNGKLLAVKRVIREGDEYEKRESHEIYELDGLKLVHSTKLSGVANIQFSPDSKRLYYKLSTDNGQELWEQTLATKETRRLLKAVKDMEGYDVLPDGTGVVYAVAKEKPENKTGYDLFRELDDRPTGYNDRRELFLFDTYTGVTRQLSKAGDFDLATWSLSPSGERLLLIRNLPKDTRPYVTQEFWTYVLASGELTRISTRNLLRYPQDITWLDEYRVAYTSGSHDAAPEDTVYHNVSQLVLNVLDLRTGVTRNLTADARFSLNDEEKHSRLHFEPASQSFLVHVSNGGEQQFARVALEGSKITYRPLNIRWDFTDFPAMAQNGSRIAYQAADFDSPKAIYVYDVAARTERLLLDPNREVVAEWEMGTMEEWSFTNRLGYEIEGWVYKPADFTPDKQWPVIVYYYAGVSPRDVRFSIQYQMWLANGYVMYVLNPVGSAAYGQEFADVHAGDWGTEATQDVIEGTEKVLAAHPWMDKSKVGCYGGSYGGFVTLDLLTKSKQFACAVDMYGISNIANYFGGGAWGVWYSDIASPGQFPWNNRDLFVNNSPVFNADKISTPTLILHGGADVNVPWLESDQMFVALKLLGQDVVYARFQGETHNINTKYKNLLEHRQMMLEWFDKYLKNQPDAWDVRLESYGK
ncbi:MAG: S9 family peptidase [bacterium]|nr:S9 family peptidase [bacterium]